MATSDYHRQKRASGKKRVHKIIARAKQCMWICFMLVLFTNGTSATLADIPPDNIPSYNRTWTPNIQLGLQNKDINGKTAGGGATIDNITCGVPCTSKSQDEQQHKDVLDIRAYAVQAYVSGEEIDDNFMEFDVQTDHACPDNCATHTIWKDRKHIIGEIRPTKYMVRGATGIAPAEGECDIGFTLRADD